MLSLNLYTDTSDSVGYVGTLALSGFSELGNNLIHHHIRFFPIVLSVLLFGDKMRNQRITFFTDNAALVEFISQATSLGATVMVFVCQLVMACLNFNILFRARHVPGVKNVLADSLSQLQVFQFRRLAPVGVQTSPTAIPTPLLPHNWLTLHLN